MKFDVYSDGHYLCKINQTLRVIDMPIERECTTSERNARINAMQYFMDQQPADLLIMPEHEHKRTKAVKLSQAAPDRVRVGQPKNSQKCQSNGKGKGSHFLKIISKEINDTQTAKRANSANLKSGETG